MSAGQSVTSATMYCRTCSYVLDGLPECRCPECGQGFDPARRDTYRTKPRRRRWPLVLGLTLILCVASAVGLYYWRTSAPPSGVVRVQFDPKASGKGVTSWTSLFRFKAGGKFLASCRAKVGGRIPIRFKGGPILFHVLLVDGNDDQLTVDVEVSGAANRTLTLVRDRRVSFEVAAKTYELLYPSTQVASTQPVIENTAMILVSHTAG